MNNRTSDQGFKGEPEAKTQVYGAQDAARFLGIHRSTLHLAIKRNLLVPDYLTPGGHFRFYRETLDTFSARLTHEPATSDTRILSELAPTLTIADGAAEFCHLTFARIRHVYQDITMFGVALRYPTPHDPHALQTVAQEGFSPRLDEIYASMRPAMEFASTIALRTLEPEICEDIATTPGLRLGTVRIATRAGMRSFVVLPLRVGDDALGVFTVASPEPRKFPAHEIGFLQSFADDLSVALAFHDKLTRLRSRLSAAAELTQCALILRLAQADPHTSVPNERLGTQVRGLQTLRRLYQRHSGAEVAVIAGSAAPGDVAWYAAPAAGVPGPLGKLVRRAQASGRIERAQRAEEDGERKGLALSLPLGPGQKLAVGAAWRADAFEGTAEEALLVAFGGACVLALGPGALGQLPGLPKVD